ncbi:MAG: hypothetical protein QOK05_1444 [Chloroflexota bacterium]|jgi:hypothetical protein|nr:hypothetical protein [Chloroflexota bacterium]
MTTNQQHKENHMTITPTKITRAAGVAAALSGLIFIGVQVKHPHMDIRSITTNDVLVRDSLKLLMAALALAGITGMYARQVTKMGVLGLVGFVLFTAGYLGIACTAFVAAFVLPTLAHTAPAYTADLIAAANNGKAIGDIGLMQTVIYLTGIGYLAGGLLFGIAMFRANVLPRWAAALLAVGTVASIGAAILPQYERLFPIPTGIAMIGLGYSLWRQRSAPVTSPVSNPVTSQLAAVGAG